jgi:hypothetical protein
LIAVGVAEGNLLRRKRYWTSEWDCLPAHYGVSLAAVGAEEGLGGAGRHCISEKANPVGTENFAGPTLVAYYRALDREEREWMSE